MNNARCLFMTPEIRELAKKFPGETEESVKNLVGLWQEKRHKSPDTYPSELELKRFIKEIRNPARENQAGTLTNNLNNGEINNENDKGRVAQGVQEGTSGSRLEQQTDRGGGKFNQNTGINRNSSDPTGVGRTRDYVTQRLQGYSQGKGVLINDLSDEEYRDALSEDPLTHYVVFANHGIDKERYKGNLTESETSQCP